jgi:hypothetical protein
MIVTKGNYNVIWSYLTMTMIVFSWIFLLFSCQSVPVEVITESVEPKVSIEQDVPLAEEPLKTSEPIVDNKVENADEDPEISSEDVIVSTEEDSSEITSISNSPEYSQLTNTEIENIIINTLPSSFLPVTNDNGSIKIIYNDLDQNGYRDAFFLLVKDRENLDANFSSLSDISQLIKNKRPKVDFFLALYMQLKGGMISMFRIPIGSSPVITEFLSVAIKEGETLPFGINILFQTLKDAHREWIIFSSYNKFSLFSMTDNISAFSVISDIDNDSIIDIVDWEDGLEEGTGYETYLTWYKWNGKEYREYRSTNIVRNLNGFLEQARLYLSFNQIDEFFRSSLNAKDLKKFINSGNTVSDFMGSIFRQVPGSLSEQDELLDCKDIHSVIFPQIFENPYSPGKEGDSICNINVRFVCYDGYSFIRTARVIMSSNPFEKPQFSFYLE